MTEEQRRKWDAINDLRKAAFERFDSRRKFEYRLLGLFWGAIGALTLLILKGELKSWSCIHSWGLTLISILCLVLFFRWTAGLNRAHLLDRRTSLHFEREMMEVAGLNYSDKIEKELEKLDSREDLFSYWSHQLQIAISALLILALLITAWMK